MLRSSYKDFRGFLFVCFGGFALLWGQVRPEERSIRFLY